MRDLRDGFSRAASRLAGELARRGTVDGVPDIAEAFPLQVFADAVGLAEPGGEQLLAYGNMAFNAFGPRNELTRASLRQAAEVGAWIAAQCTRDALVPGGLGARIYASVDDGTISEDEAALLVRSLLTAGVDTTVIGLGCALDCLARDPAQWQLLREDPAPGRGRVRGVAAVRVAGADVLPHHHPRGHGERGADRRGREGAAVPRGREP